MKNLLSIPLRIVQAAVNTAKPSTAKNRIAPVALITGIIALVTQYLLGQQLPTEINDALALIIAAIIGNHYKNAPKTKTQNKPKQ